jgi:hypothetical protein
MYHRLQVSSALLAAALIAASAVFSGAAARVPSVPPPTDKRPHPQRTLVLDGSPVQNVGNLLLHVPNWGMFGSMPNSTLPFSGAPSAEWPAGSGVEYLFAAGLWVGAIKDGIPAVSTAAYEFEFRPTQDPVDVVYYAAEGDPGGNRLPHPNADDDGDGLIDEEWLDGHDNDGDGLIDEDFAAISDQMLSCWYTDDQPEAVQVYPNHNPLHILVRQRTFQWSDPAFDDFVGFDYTITNTGLSTLDDVYLGVFVDGDVGSRDTPNYWADDATGYLTHPIQCTPWGGKPVEFAYVYDADGDGGQATGWCGLLILDHTTDPTGATAPQHVGFSTYAAFSGSQSWEEGGDPTNDFERYETMSRGTIDRGETNADVRFLVTVGPFTELPPGGTLQFRVALFAGDAAGGAIGDVLNNAAAAKSAYDGLWYDLDADPTTGVDGRETPVYGPATDVVVDSCESPPIVIPFVPEGEVAWVNEDCAFEEYSRVLCGYAPSDTVWYRTGTGGRESQIHWTLPTNVPVPVLVTRFDVRVSGLAAVVSWDVFADEPFEGFRLHRTTADGRTTVLANGASLLPPDSRSYVDEDVNAGETYRYTLIAVRSDGAEVASRSVETTIPALKTTLHQNYPNPFNPSTTISFTLAERGPVNLSVFTTEGKRVVTLVDEILPAGPNDVSWDGRDAAGRIASSGVYVYRLEAGKVVLSRKMIYLK